MKNYIHYVVIGILASTVPNKLIGNIEPYLDHFFDGITGGYGEYVMAFIGLQELLVCYLLWNSKTRYYGSIGAVLTMSGALSTHIYLGEFDWVFALALTTMTLSLFTYKLNKPCDGICKCKP